MKVAFFDRDGTIIKDYLDEEWSTIVTPEFYSDTFAVLQSLLAQDFQIILITNQYLIEEGFITQKQYEDFTQKLLLELAQRGITLLDIFYCPHKRTANCNCCKPSPGLILQALEKYPKIDLQTSFFVGDSKADLGIAAHFDLPIFYLGKDVEKSKVNNIIPIQSLREIPIK